MNEEKIKELWWKARLGYNEQNCDPEVLAKFAELIVQDCRDMFIVGSPSWNLLNEKLEHFGVEE